MFPQRVRLRYSLRALLILLTLVAIWMGYWSVSAAKQKAGTAAIREMGGSVLYNYQVRNGMTMNGVPPGPDWLRRLLGRDWFDTVVFVEFYSKPGNATDEQLAAALSKLPRVFALHLHRPQVGETTLKTVSGMRQLEVLGLVGPNITDDSLQYIYPLRNLRQLNLRGTNISDAGIKTIQAAIPSVFINNQRTPETKGGIFE
jgi:hypothetical protein